MMSQHQVHSNHDGQKEQDTCQIGMERVFLACEPTTVQETMDSADAAEWNEAMQKEIKISLQQLCVGPC